MKPPAMPETTGLFKTKSIRLTRYRPLKEFEALVDLKRMETGKIRAGDLCVLGLDVGSTTTKAVLCAIG